MAEENNREYCEEFWKLYEAWDTAAGTRAEKEAWQAMEKHKAQCETCRKLDERVD